VDGALKRISFVSVLPSEKEEKGEGRREKEREGRREEIVKKFL